MVRAGNRDEDVLASLAGRLDRMERKLSKAQAETIEKASGGVSLRTIVAGLLDALDPDKEDAKARELHGLPDDAEPTLEVAWDTPIAIDHLRLVGLEAAGAIGCGSKPCLPGKGGIKDALGIESNGKCDIQHRQFRLLNQQFAGLFYTIPIHETREIDFELNIKVLRELMRRQLHRCSELWKGQILLFV